MRLFVWAFGPVGGYLALRYVLILVAGVPLYYVIKKYLGTFAAVLAYAAMVSAPFTARALLWDYVDATGIPFLSAAICLFLLSSRPVWLSSTIAGCFLGLALNTNIYTVTIAGLFGAAYLTTAAVYRRWHTELFWRIAFAAGGVALVFVTGVLYYHHVGHFRNFLHPTFQYASYVAKGGAKRWRTARVSWIGTNLQVLVPLVLVLYGMISGLRGKWDFGKSLILLFGVLVTAFYYVYHFVFQGNVLEIFYYFSYTSPAVFLMLGLLYGGIWKGSEPSRRAVAAIALPPLVASFLLPWILQASGIAVFGWAHLWQYAVVACVSGAVVLACARAKALGRAKLALQIVATVLIGFTFNAGFASPIYVSMVKPYGSRDAAMELDVYRVALQLVKTLPAVRERPGKLQFWYTNYVPGPTGYAPGPIDSIQSTYLWAYSKCTPIASHDEDPGMPYIGAYERARFNEEKRKYVALLAENDAEIQAGLAALMKEGIPFRREEGHILSSGSYQLHVELIEMMPAEAERAEEGNDKTGNLTQRAQRTQSGTKEEEKR